MQDNSGGAQAGVIYHLTPLSELAAGVSGDHYSPARLEMDGFVHCTSGEATTLLVAGDYFADLREPLLVMEIETAHLTHDLRFEAPAPIEGGGRAHLESADRFPHVYGPIDLAAIRGVASLGEGGGPYRWPDRFEPLSSRLETTA